ncbi:MAG: TIGR03618 family F420-dependent PPOX class oxidoreductase [Acidimicrobiales bacterium]
MTLDKDVTSLATQANLATIVTLMSDGQPQAQLRWIDCDDEALLVNTEPQRQAAKNVARDPRITVLIQSATNPMEWAEVRGKVTETIGGSQARAHIDKLSRKYTGGDYPIAVGPQGRIILRIVPTRTVTPATIAASHPS